MPLVVVSGVNATLVGGSVVFCGGGCRGEFIEAEDVDDWELVPGLSTTGETNQLIGHGVGHTAGVDPDDGRVVGWSPTSWRAKVYAESVVFFERKEISRAGGRDPPETLGLEGDKHSLDFVLVTD